MSKQRPNDTITFEGEVYHAFSALLAQKIGLHAAIVVFSVV